MRNDKRAFSLYFNNRTNVNKIKNNDGNSLKGKDRNHIITGENENNNAASMEISSFFVNNLTKKKTKILDKLPNKTEVKAMACNNEKLPNRLINR